ncbi:MAG: hypothetical protein II305_06785 [Clostridia bacterium]|nr:hypothetical protein [Clostridia bacterium]
MTNGQILQTAFEGLVIILLILGLFFEEKLAILESKIIDCCKILIKKSIKRILKSQNKIKKRIKERVINVLKY